MAGFVTTSRAHYYQYNPSRDVWESRYITIPLSARDVKIVEAAKKHLYSKGYAGADGLQLFHYTPPSEEQGLLVFCDSWGDRHKLVTADGETFHLRKGRYSCCTIL